jgi:hypothetical protein
MRKPTADSGTAAKANNRFESRTHTEHTTRQ